MGEDLNEVVKTPYPWQTTISNILDKKPDRREIIWIFDPTGKNGKSTYAKYLIFKKDALLLSWDPGRDIFFARKVNKHKNIVLFDFTRSVPKFVDSGEVFSSIEQIKNGVLFSGKYDSEAVITSNPHLICFSNYLPTDPGAISLDRWSLYRLGNTTKQLIHMDNKQANDFIIDYIKFEEKHQPTSTKNKKPNKKSQSQSKAIPPSHQLEFKVPSFLTEEEYLAELAVHDLSKINRGPS